MTSAQEIPLPQLAATLRREYGATVPYRSLHLRVVDGDLPAQQRNGRWFIRREDLQHVAELLGIAVAA